MSEHQPMTSSRQPHPQRCETCKKRETLQCPIQDEDIYYKIKQQVTVPTGWEILTSCIGCASHSTTHTSPQAPCCEACINWKDIQMYEAAAAKASREQVLKEIGDFIDNPDNNFDTQTHGKGVLIGNLVVKMISLGWIP